MASQAQALSGEAYPLYWPEGWPRSHHRRNGPYAVVAGEKKIECVIACDQWARVKDNLRAAGLALAALRALKRSGASQILDRAFVGLTATALAASNPVRTWREVFGIDRTRPVTRGDLEAQYKMLVALRHPDRGGSHEEMTELNRAYEQAKAELS